MHHNAPIECVVVLPDGRIATAAANQIHLWTHTNVTKQPLVFSLPANDIVRHLSIAPEGCIVAYHEEEIGQSNPKVSFLDTKGFKLLPRENLLALSQRSHCISVLPQGLLMSFTKNNWEVLDIWSGERQEVKMSGNPTSVCVMQPAMDLEAWMQVRAKRKQSQSSILLRTFLFR
jgi:hypothetical protein